MPEQRTILKTHAKSLLSVVALAVSMIDLSGCAGQKLQSENTSVHSGNILLMGEVHDNPAGHQRRFEDLQKFVLEGARPVLAMEQFDREYQAELSKAQAECGTADCLLSHLNDKIAGERSKKTWDWAYYRPVIQLALDYKLPLLAANLSRHDAARVMHEGYAAALDAGTIQNYQLDQLLPVSLVGGQRVELEAGHCGKMPSDLMPGMIRAQIARDVWMAKLIASQAGHDVVLLAGNGHVRRDLGVPHWLSADQQAHLQIHAYVEANTDAGTHNDLYDFTHIVQALPRPDPCQAIAGSTSQKAVE